MRTFFPSNITVSGAGVWLTINHSLQVEDGERRSHGKAKLGASLKDDNYCYHFTVKKAKLCPFTKSLFCFLGSTRIG